MARLELNKISKTYEGGTTAIRDVDLTIEDGEFMVLVGPSGCGKSTLLRIIAGLETATSGEVVLDGQDVSRAQPEDRNLAMVFQNYALYPHMSVERNLGFGLKLRRVDKKEAAQRVSQAAHVLGLDELMRRKPGQLSGGQRQRVALGRAMVRDPHAYLMDEPLSNLDAKLRVAMRTELARLHERLGVTTVYVTHDQVEAMTLGQRVAVLNDGVLQQCATPLELYEQPSNLFVASFIGSPQMNLARAQVIDRRLHLGDHVIPLPEDAPQRLPREVVVGIRPTDLHLADASGKGPDAEITVEPALVEELGSERMLMFSIGTPPVQVEAPDDGEPAAAADEAPLLADDSASYFSARLPARTPITPGQATRLTFETDWLYLFDPTDGHVLRAPARGVSSTAAARNDSGG